MKVGLVGPSYETRSLPFDAQRTINLYPVMNETGQGKEIAALFGTPGLEIFATVGSGPIRGEFSAANGRAFVVSNTEIFEIFSDGTYTSRGSLVTEDSTCTFEENPAQLFVCDGTTGYTLTYATNSWAEVADGDFPGASTVTFLDGYFIVNKPDSGEYYISGLNDGTTWAALDFATAESAPDNLVRPFALGAQLWLFGAYTGEIAYNSGNVDFPFERISGAKLDTGCAAAHSVVKLDNSLFWVGKNLDGQGIVYRAQGYTPVRISTHAVEYSLQKSGDLSGLKAWSYQQDGHSFYVLTGGNLTTTWVYDVSTQQWHERQTLEEDGTMTAYRGSSCMFAFNKHLVGDRTNANVYVMSQAVYTDNQNQIRRQRVFTHIFNEGVRFRANALVVDFEYGVGNSSVTDPVAWLEISTDGGRTWSNEYEAKIGKIGEYRGRAVWRRLGVARQMTFRVTVSDPVKIAICGSYLQ